MKSINFLTPGCMLLLLMLSCNPQPSDKTTKNDQKDQFIFEDTPNDVLGNINQTIISPDTAENGIVSTAAKGSLWTIFTKTFKDCWQDETFKKNIVYLGPSNSKYLGAILSKDKQTTWKTLEKVFGQDYDQLKKFCQAGSEAPDNCDKDELISNYFNILLDGSYATSLDGNLKLTLEDRKHIKMLTGKWRVDEIILGDFNSYMDTAKNQSVIDYKKYLTSGSNYLLTKVLVIEDFSAEIETNRKIDAGLEGKLDKGIKMELLGQNADSLNAKMKIAFTRTSDGKVKVSATGKSYAIGMLQKVKKVKQ